MAVKVSVKEFALILKCCFGENEFRMVHSESYKIRLSFTTAAIDRIAAARIFCLSDYSVKIYDEFGRIRFYNGEVR